MMEEARITLTIPGEPQGKQRPRAWRGPKGMKPMTYTPAKTVNFETFIKERFAAEHPDFELLEGPLIIEIRAWFTIPRSVSKVKQERMMQNKIRPTKRPDIDNIIKIVLDALEGLAFVDDKQVVTVVVAKLFANRPRTEIEISQLTRD